MYFRWMIQNNHIKNCDATVRDIDISQDVWYKNIDSLKGKTTHIKPNPVVGDMIKIAKELLKLNKTLFLTVDVFKMGKNVFLNQFQY